MPTLCPMFAVYGSLQQGEVQLGVAAAVGVLLVASAMKTRRERRRLAPLQGPVSTVASATGDVAVVRGHVVAHDTLFLSDSTDLVWWRAVETSTVERMYPYRTSSGGLVMEYIGEDQEADARSAGVPFAIQDPTGWASVDPRRADVRARTLERSRRGGTWHMEGLRVGDEVTVAGPVRRLSETEIIFEARRRDHRDVVLSTQSPGKLGRWAGRRRSWRALVTSSWALLLIAILAAGAR